MRISVELVPRNSADLLTDATTVRAVMPEASAFNIPDLSRFSLRSWEACLREREAIHLQWIDISFSRRTLQVRSKPQYKHRIKTAEERELPLTQELVAQLQAYRQQLPAGRKLVFGKLSGREDAPDGHLLRRLKILDLGCGTCATCVAKTGCENWWLHKFRATSTSRQPCCGPGWI